MISHYELMNDELFYIKNSVEMMGFLRNDPIIMVIISTIQNKKIVINKKLF